MLTILNHHPILFDPLRGWVCLRHKACAPVVLLRDAQRRVDAASGWLPEPDDEAVA